MNSVPPPSPIPSSLEKMDEEEDDPDVVFADLFEGANYDSEDDFDQDLLARHHQQFYETDGFDVIDFPPGQCWYTYVFPMTHYLLDPDPEYVDKMKDYAGKALKQYNNDKGTNYEVKEILKLNGGGNRDFIYYITFSVKNGEAYIFQAQVVRYIEGHLGFPIVRPKREAVVR